MHRAEKSSSRICRTREVERAQELHRKKIDGVKSYLTGIVSRPTAVKPLVGATFRRFKPAASSRSPLCSTADVGGDGSESDYDDNANEDDDEMPSADDNELYGSSAPMSSAGSAFFSTPSGGSDTTESHTSMAFAINKADEFRSVAPVPLQGKQASHQHQHQQLLLHARAPAASNSTTSLKKNSLNSSFRTRRLKEIKADNVGLFERIRKSAAHYRNDDLKREWAQNVSYLSSICEFPVVLTSPRNQHQRHGDSSDGDEEELGMSTTHSGPGTPARHHPQLPRIHQPAAVHPIRAVPTSPRRLQLNLSPAFRSLRKGMPQQPALPPISASPSTSTFGSLASPTSVFASSSAMASSVSIAGYKFHGSSSQESHPHHPVDSQASESDSDGHVNDSDVPTLPSRATTVGSPFVGDLSSPSATQLHDETKYQLLKLGRFVGGTYLVLTVFCGDGVRNPYGFDVVAFDRASQCEFSLCVTKQMTHELLDAISSSSQAAATAAAAGTNLSMEQIARSICDHVNFATLESGLGEMTFLTASVGGSASRSDHCALLLDTASSSIALCLHQCIEIEMASSRGTAVSGTRKHKLHVFASTRPQKSTPTTYDESAAGHFSSSATVCFQVRDVDTHVSTTHEANSSSALALEVEIELHELYAIVSGQWHGDDSASPSWKSCGTRKKRAKASQATQTAHVSIECAMAAAIRHLHIVNVPSGDASDELKQVLIVNRHVNALLHLVPHALSKARALEKTRSRQHLPRAATSPTRALSLITRGVRVLESGVLWKNAYVLARVSIDRKSDSNDSDDNSESCDDRDHAASNVLPQYVQDIETSIRVVVFNSLTSKYSERALCPEQVDAVVAKLDALIPSDDDTEFQETSAFVKQLLLRLEIEVDLFGTEVLTFPALEIKQPLNSHTEQLALHRSFSVDNTSTASSRRSLTGRHASKRTIGRGRSSRMHEDDNSEGSDEDVDVDTAATCIQAHVRGFLFRLQYYGTDDDQLDDDDDVDRDADSNTRECSNISDAEDAGETTSVSRDCSDQCEARDQHTEMQFQSSASRSVSRSESRSRTQREATAECELIQPDNIAPADGLRDIEIDATLPEAAPEALATPDSHDIASERKSSSTSSDELNLLATADKRRGVKINRAFCLVRDTVKLQRDGSESKQVVFAIRALGELEQQDLAAQAAAQDDKQGSSSSKRV